MENATTGRYRVPQRHVRAASNPDQGSSAKVSWRRTSLNLVLERLINQMGRGGGGRIKGHIFQAEGAAYIKA